MKKLAFLNTNFQSSRQYSYIAELQDLEISATKMTVFSILYKIRNENFFYNCFNEAFVKTFMIKLLLFNKNSEIRFRIQYFIKFYDIKSSAKKMRALNCNVKIEKIPFPLLSLLLFFMKKPSFFNTCISKFISRCGIIQT